MHITALVVWSSAAGLLVLALHNPAFWHGHSLVAEDRCYDSCQTRVVGKRTGWKMDGGILCFVYSPLIVA